jgi:hypothetical protein
MVTPVLPATATTGVVLLPEQVTVVPLVGVVVGTHWATAGDLTAASRKTEMTTLPTHLANVAPVAVPPDKHLSCAARRSE